MSRREDHADRFPEPQCAVTDRQHRGGHPAAAAAPQQIGPRLPDTHQPGRQAPCGHQHAPRPSPAGTAWSAPGGRSRRPTRRRSRCPRGHAANTLPGTSILASSGCERRDQPLTRKTSVSSGSPLSCCAPRLSKASPDPTDRSRTVRLVSTSPGRPARLSARRCGRPFRSTRRRAARTRRLSHSLTSASGPPFSSPNVL
ncbi:MAG: hypothetical protein JWR34_512 [Mycobacterium sp.]|nr:hypothetical protein [Mycobacterium sp.]